MNHHLVLQARVTRRVSPCILHHILIVSLRVVVNSVLLNILDFSILSRVQGDVIQEIQPYHEVLP